MLSSWIKTGLDRVLLSNSGDISANGIYSSAFQISIVVSLIGIGFNKAFSPALYKKINNKEYKSTRNILLKFFLVNFIMVFLNVYIILSNILFHVKKTLTLSMISVFSAIVHIILLYLLLNKYSEFGAAVSFLISAIIQTLLTAFFTYKKASFIWK